MLLSRMVTLEAATGLALLLVPSFVLNFLVGVVLGTPGGLVVSRVSGVELNWRRRGATSRTPGADMLTPRKVMKGGSHLGFRCILLSARGA
jgi:hypothetical protein